MFLISRLIRPQAWIRNESYNEVVDIWFTEALKNPTFTNVSEHTCNLNGKEIWISNRYYGGPYLYSGSDPQGFCSVANAAKVYKLTDKIRKEKLLAENKKWMDKNVIPVEKPKPKKIEVPKVLKSLKKPEKVAEVVQSKKREFCTVN